MSRHRRAGHPGFVLDSQFSGAIGAIVESSGNLSATSFNDVALARW
jgi:hypothetical protein